MEELRRQLAIKFGIHISYDMIPKKIEELDSHNIRNCIVYYTNHSDPRMARIYQEELDRRHPKPMSEEDYKEKFLSQIAVNNDLRARARELQEQINKLEYKLEKIREVSK